MHSPLATRNAPSFRLIQAHFALGIAAMCGFAVALLVASPSLGGHHFQPVMLGLVHLCVLGWLLPIALGAMHQLVPVLFEIRVASEKLAWASLAAYVVGAAGLVTHFFGMWTGPGLFASAAVLTAALLAYAVNLLITIGRSKATSLTNGYVVWALIWLLVGGTIGLVLATNLWRPFLPVNHLVVLRAHAHAAALGFFGLLIAGVALRLLEMFLISHGATERAGRLALWLFNLGLVGVVVGYGFTLDGPLVLAGAILIAGAVAAYLVQVRRVLARRMKRKLDAAWRMSVGAFGYLAVAALLGLLLVALPLEPAVQDRAVLGYGLVAIPGFIGSIVVGQLYKIVPFLIWLHRFSPYVGLKKIPSASELLPEPPRRAHEGLFHLGLLALVAGIAVDLGALRIAGAGAFLAASVVGARNLWVLFRSRP